MADSVSVNPWPSVWKAFEDILVPEVSSLSWIEYSASEIVEGGVHIR